MSLFKSVFGRRDDHFDAVILLLTDYRNVDEQLVRLALPESAGRVEISRSDEERLTLKSPAFQLDVLSRAHPYGPRGSGTSFLADRTANLLLKDLLHRHTAFVSINSHSDTPPTLREKTKTMTTRIAGALVDDSVVLVMDAHTNRMLIPSEASIEQLRRSNRDRAFESGAPESAVDVRSGSLSSQIAEARSMYPSFRAAFLRRKEGSMFALKMSFTEGDTTEHMWIDPTDVLEDSITGRLMNEPHRLRRVRNGDVVTKSLSDLTDWVYVEDDQGFGAFTEAKVRQG